jgi:hypothetical protein
MVFKNFRPRNKTEMTFLLGSVGFVLCHLGLPNEFPHPKDQINPF